MKAQLLNHSFTAAVYLCLVAATSCASDKQSTDSNAAASASVTSHADAAAPIEHTDAAVTTESSASVAAVTDAGNPVTAASRAVATLSDAGTPVTTAVVSALTANAAAATTPSAAATTQTVTASEEDAAFAGIWSGLWLSASGQTGRSKLTTTLDGTTVGGIAEVDGTKKSDLSGTFIDGNFLGSYYSTTTFTFDLNVRGQFLVGKYSGGTAQLATAVMRAPTASAAPASFPTKLVGTWKGLLSGDTDNITITLADGDGMLSGHITAPGLVDFDAYFAYTDGELQGGNFLIQLSLLASGNHFVGTYGKEGTDIGIIDVMAE